MITEQEVLQMLTESGAISKGHFILSSGRHAEMYVQCARVLEDPRRAEILGKALAICVKEKVDRVISPILGGILIGHEVARALDRPFLFPERGSNGEFCLRRGFTLNPQERVLIVEDVVTTGQTTEEILALLADNETQPVGLVAIVDRSSSHVVEGMSVQSLIQLDFSNYSPEECPLCAKGISAHRPGSRAKEVQAQLS
ncbi:orotate phosphoribosyltransferase [Patescibacteria group bacterium]|nr:orotate phosphoribosyltransferase [Patescibacteria group bacterium]MBU4022931.1 orotate phosphoribosyltransferase [Patescibacteria group bacterium]MBU4078295.1 orotate phosphoribosyltransferase [Patescibacteria group bacterium]